MDGLIVLNHDEGDVFVESDDADAGPSGNDFGEEVIVRLTCADVHFVPGRGGGDDVLRRLLGEADAFYLEAGIAKDGGDEVSTGDFA